MHPGWWQLMPGALVKHLDSHRGLVKQVRGPYELRSVDHSHECMPVQLRMNEQAMPLTLLCLNGCRHKGTRDLQQHPARCTGRPQLSTERIHSMQQTAAAAGDTVH